MERAEKIGLGIATAGHVLLFALLSAGFLAAPKPLKLPNTPMDVSIVDPVALESAAPRVTSEPPPPAQAPEQGTPEEAAPVPPEPKSAPPPPTPKPPLPKPAPKSVEKVKPLPPTPPVAKKAQLIKTPTPKRRTETAPPKKLTPVSPTKATPANKPPKPTTASGAGKATQTRGRGLPGDLLKGVTPEAPARPAKADAPSATKLSAIETRALNNAISEQIYRHLRLPSGADVELLVAMLDVKLDKSGAVVGTPQVLDVQGVTESNRPQIGLYKERAIQAVLQASPFQGLPVDHYSEWRWLSPLRVYARKAQ